MNALRAARPDSLALLCIHYDASGRTDARIYRLYRAALAHPDFITPTERTLQQNETVTVAPQLFNFEEFSLGVSARRSKPLSDDDSTLRLLSHDKSKLMDFGNRIMIYQGVVSFYNVRLKEMNAHAVALIQTLKNEYP